VSDCCLKFNVQFSLALSWWEHVTMYIQSDDDNGYFVLDQHA
jgi:hypothetical protein